MGIKKKILIIFPPQWTPISPYFAVPQLAGQIKANGFDVETLDLNIEFFNDILNEQKLIEAILKSKLEYDYLQRNLLKVFVPNKKAIEYTQDEQIFLFKYNRIKKYLQNNINEIKTIPNLIDEAKNCIKGTDFYNPEKLINSLRIIDKALEMASLPYTPTKIEFEGLQNPFFKFNLDSIKYFVFDEKSNIFLEYYKKRLQDILNKKADFIAISLNSSSQIVPGLTLTNLLKKETKAHINIGGNFFGRISEELVKHPAFFELFADSVSIEEGEGPIVEEAKFANGLISIENVPNFLYLKDGKVKVNEKMTPIKLNDMANMDISDYKLDKYFTPKIILPYQSSRGCYWGKCSFCDQAFGQKLNFKQTDKIFSELKEFKEKYNIDSFEFIDESVSPTALKSLSDKLNKEKLDIKYFFDARLEEDFTPELLEEAHKSGVKIILWGLESGSKKVMELINKGVDFDKRFEILKNSGNAGIWNFAFIFFGFPAETVEDAKLTVKMLIENKDIIHSYGRSIYTMGRHSKLAENPEKYGIIKIHPAEEEFSTNIKFEAKGMTQTELREITDYCLKECSIAYKLPLWMCLRNREFLFLYIEKYGVDWVKNYKISEDI